MAKKLIQQKLYDAAAKVCSEGCISCFECGKEKSKYTLPAMSGSQLKECPLAKFNVARTPIDPTNFLARWANEPTYEDLELLCLHCEHRDSSRDTDDEFSLKNCFMTHCLSCPVESARDCLDERAAEARSS